MKTTVDAVRPELTEFLPKYNKIRDCLLGEDHIKSKGELYLPRPTKDDNPIEYERSNDYLQRATFLNATGLTQRTIVGKLFTNPQTCLLYTSPSPRD